MARMTGGEAIVKQLYREGLRVVFGLPGVQLYGIWAALRDEPRIRLVTTRHEQATSYMADGYTRASGNIGAALVVPGPGLLNASSGLSTAYSASSPVLMIAGQVQRANIGRDVGMLHEVNDQQDAISPVTKWRRRALKVEDCPGAVHEAIYQLKTGRPRPVEIEFPPETMEEEGEAELIEPAKPLRPAARAADIDRAADLLLAAKQPVIYAGGGVQLSGAENALRNLAEHLQIGVIHSFEGKGAIDDRHHLSLGSALLWYGPLRDHFNGSDLILAVGTRFAQAMPLPEQQVVQIDIDPEEIGRNHRKTMGVAGDARATLEELFRRVKTVPKRPARKAGFEALKAASNSTGSDEEPQNSILRNLRSGIPDDGILISGMTQVGYFSRPFWPTYAPRTYITSGYSGNLGYEYPTGLGAKVGCPDRAVVVTVGDGGFLYNSSEMATAVQHKINVVCVLFNDNAFGNVTRDMDEGWGGQYGGTLHNPDFMKLADAYGMHGMRAAKPADVGKLVADAVQMDRPVLIEVPVGRMNRPKAWASRKWDNKYVRQPVQKAGAR
ncbi:MAG: thiamine pyrophosphate-binding protein [Chloroflexi bacterium]|nr:thiamine pyrophosphate-binding protein [Chloroflexota bacterium]